MTTQQTRQFLRLKQVKQIVGLGRTCIYQKIKDGEFPPPIPIGIRAVAWLSTDLEEWVSARVDASRSNTASKMYEHAPRKKTV